MCLSLISKRKSFCHDDVIKWKHRPRYWPFVWGIHQSPVNSPHKDQWRRALMLSLICVWINSSVNNRQGGDLRCYRTHYDITVTVSISVWHVCTLHQSSAILGKPSVSMETSIMQSKLETAKVHLPFEILCWQMPLYIMPKWKCHSKKLWASGTDYFKILHMPWQLCCHGMCKKVSVICWTRPK